MVSLFFVIFLVLTVILVLKSMKESRIEEGTWERFRFYYTLSVILGIVTAIFFIWTFILISTLEAKRATDNEIPMYEERCVTTEERIDTGEKLPEV